MCTGEIYNITKLAKGHCFNFLLLKINGPAGIRMLWLTAVHFPLSTFGAFDFNLT